MNLSRQLFSSVDIEDPFFNSLKADYAEFAVWFAKKAKESAYVFKRDSGEVAGFLYVKKEVGPVVDVVPPLPSSNRLKVGTFKVDPHGTKLGERFMKKIFDHAIAESVAEVYVTLFKKHEALVTLFKRYGFNNQASKTTANGGELVLVKKMLDAGGALLERYPIVKVDNNAAYLLSIYPEWHTRLLPDSILKSEDATIVQDISHTNSIHKVYLARMDGMEALRPGDVLIIYRTTDSAGPAHYRSVATSVCVVEEYRDIRTFSSKDEFFHYCKPYSVFEAKELDDFWRSKKYPHIVRFTYNLALPKRITRGIMIEELAYDAKAYWGFMKLTNKQVRDLLKAGKVNENLIID